MVQRTISPLRDNGLCAVQQPPQQRLDDYTAKRQWWCWSHLTSGPLPSHTRLLAEQHVGDDPSQPLLRCATV